MCSLLKYDKFCNSSSVFSSSRRLLIPMNNVSGVLFQFTELWSHHRAFSQIITSSTLRRHVAQRPLMN